LSSDVGASTCAQDAEYLRRLNSCNDKYFDALTFACLSLIVGGSSIGSSTVRFFGSLSPVQLLNRLILNIHKAAAFVVMFVLAWTVLDLNNHKDAVRLYFLVVNVSTAATLCAVGRYTSNRGVTALIQRNALMAIVMSTVHVVLKITPPLFMQATMSILALWQDPVFQQHVLGQAADAVPTKAAAGSEVVKNDDQQKPKPEGLRQRKGKGKKAETDDAARTNPQSPSSKSGGSGRSSASGDQTFKDSVGACTKAMQLLTEALGKDGWDLKDTKSGVEIYLRQEGSFTFSMGCGVLECPPHVAMHVMEDLKIKPKIAPNWKRSETLHEFDPEALSSAGDSEWVPYKFKVVYSEIKAPFVSGRDAVGAVAQYYNPRTGALRQVCRSVVTTKCPVNKDFVRSNIINSSHEVTPLEGRTDACKMTIVAAVDPGGSIPTWVVNKLAPQNALIVHRISKLAEVSQSSNWPPLEANKALTAAQAKAKA
jgi:hypothetical protein